MSRPITPAPAGPEMGMQDSTAADPSHLGRPGHMPGDTAGRYSCTRCADTFGDAAELVRIDDQLICRLCLPACKCKTCRQHLSVEDWDDCEECLVKLFRSERAEFGDAVTRGLCKTPTGQRIARRVLDIPELPALASEPRLPAGRTPLQSDGAGAGVSARGAA